MTTHPDVQALLDWHERHLGDLVYDEMSSTRLHCKTLADLLTPTDCSGDAIRTYRYFTGLKLTDATYTGNFCTQGELVTTSLADAAAGRHMLPGDPVFYHWRGWSTNPGDPYNHVNIYGGGDLVYNHGGPDKGPVRQSLRENVSRAQAVMVRRLVQPISPLNQPSDLLEWIMSLPGAPANLTYDQLTDAIAAKVWAHRIDNDGDPKTVAPQAAQYLKSIDGNVKAVKDKVGA